MATTVVGRFTTAVDQADEANAWTIGGGFHTDQGLATVSIPAGQSSNGLLLGGLKGPVFASGITPDDFSAAVPPSAALAGLTLHWNLQTDKTDTNEVAVGLSEAQLMQNMGTTPAAIGSNMAADRLAITAVDTGANTITIGGGISSDSIKDGHWIYIYGSTGNDGLQKVTNIAGNVLTLSPGISNATADGFFANASTNSTGVPISSGASWGIEDDSFEYNIRRVGMIDNVWGATASTLKSEIDADDLGVLVKFQNNGASTVVVKVRTPGFAAHYVASSGSSDIVHTVNLHKPATVMVGNTVWADVFQTLFGGYIPSKCEVLWDFDYGSTDGLAYTSPFDGEAEFPSGNLRKINGKWYGGKAGFCQAHCYASSGSKTVACLIKLPDGRTSLKLTALTVAADTRTVEYVDAINGDNLNDGSTEALARLTPDTGNDRKIIYINGGTATAQQTFSGNNLWVINRDGTVFDDSGDNTGTLIFSGDDQTFDGFKVSSAAAGELEWGFNGSGHRNRITVLNSQDVSAGNREKGFFTATADAKSINGVYLFNCIAAAVSCNQNSILGENWLRVVFEKTLTGDSLVEHGYRALESRGNIPEWLGHTDWNCDTNKITASGKLCRKLQNRSWVYMDKCLLAGKTSTSSPGATDSPAFFGHSHKWNRIGPSANLPASTHMYEMAGMLQDTVITNSVIIGEGNTQTCIRMSETNGKVYQDFIARNNMWLTTADMSSTAQWILRSGLSQYGWFRPGGWINLDNNIATYLTSGNHTGQALVRAGSSTWPESPFRSMNGNVFPQGSGNVVQERETDYTVAGVNALSFSTVDNIGESVNYDDSQLTLANLWALDISGTWTALEGISKQVESVYSDIRGVPRDFDSVTPETWNPGPTGDEAEATAVATKDTQFRVDQAALRSGTGTQDLTNTQFTADANQAAIVIAGNGVTLDAIQSSVAWARSIAFTDGTTTICSTEAQTNGTANQENTVGHYTDGTILRAGGTSANETLSTNVATFDSFITNGLRISVDTQDGVQGYINSLLIGGDDVAVKVGTLTASGTLNGTTTVSGLPFDPSTGCVIFLMTLRGTANSPSGLNNGVSFGFAAYDGSTITQGSRSNYHRDNATECRSGVYVSNAYAHHQSSDSAFDTGHEVTSITSDGFVVTTRTGTAANPMAYLIVKLPSGQKAWAGVHSLATSTGAQSVGSSGFDRDPILGMFCPTSAPTVNTAFGNGSSGDASAASSAIGIVDEDGVAASMSFSMEDNAATMNNVSLASDDLMRHLDPDGSVDDIAAFTAFDTDGMDIDITTNGGIALQCLTLFVEGPEEVAGADRLSRASANFMMMGISAG